MKQRLEAVRKVALTQQYDTALFGGRASKSAWLTLATAAALLPALPARAETAAAEATADAAGTSAEDAQPRNSIVRRERNEPEKEPSAEESDMPVYGPPSPKVEHGKLAEIGWEEAPPYFPPALEEAINIVTRNYPSATSARAALRAANSEVKAARWLRFPSISANAVYRDRSGGASAGALDPQLVVEAPIWSGGRIEANIRQAKASEEASSAQYIETIEQLALTTNNTYFEIVRLTQSEQLLAESVKVHERLVETMERRVAQEVSPVADLELARSRTAQIQQQYTVTQSQRRTALRILAELVADPSYDLGPIPYYDPELDLPDRDAMEDQAVVFDPKLRRLRAEVDIARADLDSKKAAIFPQLNGQYSYDDVFGSRFGVVVRAQTSGGLSNFSQMNASRQRIQGALEDVRVQEQQLRRDIASDIIQYESAKRRATISRDASDTASRVSESYMRQFIAGRRSWLDVMNALREAVTAELGQADAEVGAMSAAGRLSLRTGRWAPDFEQPAISDDPESSERLNSRRFGPRRPD